jgi:hypothetical protein
MEDRSSRRMRTPVIPMARRGLSANKVACALISIGREHTMLQSEATLMQDRICRIDESLLQCTAGPYIGVRLGPQPMFVTRPLHPWKRAWRGRLVMSQRAKTGPEQVVANPFGPVLQADLLPSPSRK